MVTSLEKFKLFRHFFQFLPHLHHCPGVEFAVVEKGLPTGFGLLGLHVFDAGENGHRITAVLATVVEIMVVHLGRGPCGE